MWLGPFKRTLFVTFGVTRCVAKAGVSMGTVVLNLLKWSFKISNIEFLALYSFNTKGGKKAMIKWLFHKIQALRTRVQKKIHESYASNLQL